MSYRAQSEKGFMGIGGERFRSQREVWGGLLWTWVQFEFRPLIVTVGLSVFNSLYTSYCIKKIHVNTMRLYILWHLFFKKGGTLPPTCKLFWSIELLYPFNCFLRFLIRSRLDEATIFGNFTLYLDTASLLELDTYNAGMHITILNIFNYTIFALTSCTVELQTMRFLEFLTYHISLALKQTFSKLD